MRVRQRCADCNKRAPKHMVGARFCCRCFLYYVKSAVWRKAMKKGWVSMLCLHCLRKRLGRDLTIKDLTDTLMWGWAMTQKQTDAYLRKTLAYANSGKNTSRVW